MVSSRLALEVMGGSKSFKMWSKRLHAEKCVLCLQQTDTLGLHSYPSLSLSLYIKREEIGQRNLCLSWTGREQTNRGLLWPLISRSYAAPIQLLGQIKRLTVCVLGVCVSMCLHMWPENCFWLYLCNNAVRHLYVSVCCRYSLVGVLCVCDHVRAFMHILCVFLWLSLLSLCIAFVCACLFACAQAW